KAPARAIPPAPVTGPRPTPNATRKWVSPKAGAPAPTSSRHCAKPERGLSGGRAMAEFTFFFIPMSRAQIARWALHEVKADYDPVLVAWGNKPAALLEANP